MRRSGNLRKYDDLDAVRSFALQIEDISADVVVMENVPTLRTYGGGTAFGAMVDALHKLGYRVNATVLNAYWYGTPQMRRRLVTVAARDAFVPEPPRRADWIGDMSESPLGADSAKSRPTIRNAIDDLPPLLAGERDSRDELHVAGKLRPDVLERIRATPEGGDWTDWPPELREPRMLKRHGHQSRHYLRNPFANSYGRPSMTRRATRSPPFSVAGPTVDSSTPGRIASSRPARQRGCRASPTRSRSSRAASASGLTRERKHIGNAVPPPMARAVAEQIAVSLGF